MKLNFYHIKQKDLKKIHGKMTINKRGKKSPIPLPTVKQHHIGVWFMGFLLFGQPETQYVDQAGF